MLGCSRSTTNGYQLITLCVMILPYTLTKLVS